MNDELWRVQLGTGEIRTMTLDGLDRAFDEGLIDARVPVLAPGSSNWTTLGEAAGLDDGSLEQTPSLSPVALSAASSTFAFAPSSKPELDSDPELPDAFDIQPRRHRSILIGAIPGVLAVAAAMV
ncbi:MAG TPA: hypothetical protein VM925_20450, partial [Labilithrix sp.]|nr:hypothetical protein [Labilithrix sp.]